MLLNNKFKGQNITEFAIILALVAVVGIIALTTLGSNVNTMFTKSSKKAEAYKPFNWNTNNNNNSSTSTIEPGSLNGNINNPVKSCKDGMCDIDYGDFVLSGIPEDFSSFVQSSGVSGGTDKLASLLFQMAEQLKQNGDEVNSSEIKKLATIGHNIALLEKEVEKAFNACNGDKTCAENATNLIVSKPDGFDETYNTYEETTLFNLDLHFCVGKNQYNITNTANKTSDELDYKNVDTSNLSSVLFIDQYKKIMDSNLNDASKGIVQELYWDIGRLSDDVESGLHYLHGGEGKYFDQYYDSVTGESTLNPDLPQDPFGIYDQYKPSSLTHIDSSLICATGYNKDTGTKCH